MGMYNELNKISQNISQQSIEIKRSQEHQKQVEYIKSELDGLLWADMMEHNNIFDDDIKSIIIDDCLHNTDILLYNKNFTIQYLNKRYYTIARQVEQIKKKTDEQTSRQNQLKCEILEIKKQQEAEKLKKLQQQNAPREQVQRIKKTNSTMEVLGIVLTVICLPIGLLILCVLAAAKNQK